MSFNVAYRGIKKEGRRGGVEVIYHLMSEVFGEVEGAEDSSHIVSFWPPLSVILIIKNIFNSRRVICYEHFDIKYVSLRWRFIRRLVYPLADEVVCITNSQLEYYATFVPRKKLHLIPNPVSENTTLGGNKKKRQFLYVGHLRKLKRVDALIHAFAQIRRSDVGHDWVLKIVGDGDEKKQLQELCGKLSIGDHVIFAGYKSDTKADFEESAVFVLPSVTEGLPMVVLEAMNSDCFVIVSEYGPAVREIVQPYKNGLIVSDIGDLGDALRMAAGVFEECGSVYRFFLQNARKVKDDFSQSSFESRWRNLLEK